MYFYLFTGFTVDFGQILTRQKKNMVIWFEFRLFIMPVKRHLSNVINAISNGISTDAFHSDFF